VVGRGLFAANGLGSLAAEPRPGRLGRLDSEDSGKHALAARARWIIVPPILDTLQQYYLRQRGTLKTLIGHDETVCYYYLDFGIYRRKLEAQWLLITPPKPVGHEPAKNRPKFASSECFHRLVHCKCFHRLVVVEVEGHTNCKPI
jgi:hypothetical protein